MDVVKTFFTSPVFGFLLKFVSGLAAAGFGLFGIGTKTRDEITHRLTQDGKIALIGVLLAGFIAGVTSIYDFNTGQEKDRQERLQAQQLMLSVRRGIYPLRGVKIDLVIPIDNTLEPVRRYKETLNKTFASHVKCSAGGKDFECSNPFLNEPYSIRSTSRLFPAKNSPVELLVRNVMLEVTMFKLTSESSNSEYQQLGVFDVYWTDHLPEETSLEYDPDKDALAMAVSDVQMGDKMFGDSESRSVYSLVDFMPGLIAVEAAEFDSDLCKAFPSFSTPCLTVDLIPRKRHIPVYSARLHFSYPKEIVISEGFAITCHGKKRDVLVLPLGDIESQNSFYGPELGSWSQNQIAAACTPFKYSAKYN